jgi:hypothetical protein
MSSGELVIESSKYYPRGVCWDAQKPRPRDGVVDLVAEHGAARSDNRMAGGTLLPSPEARCGHQ